MTRFPPRTLRGRVASGMLPYRDSGPDWTREIFAGRDSGLPDMAMLGSVRYRKAYPHLPEHAHRDCYEFCLLEKGRVDWTVGEQLHLLHPGEVFISRPGEFHGGRHSVMQPCQLIFVQVSTRRCRGDSGQAVTQKLLAAFALVQRRQLPASPECRRLFRELVKERRRVDKHSAVVLRSLLNLLLTEILRMNEARPAWRTDISPGIARAHAYLADHWDEPLDIAKLARLARLGKSQFQHRFHRETSQTLGAVREERRIVALKRALAGGGESITSIAMQFGFSSSQYFATWFKRLTGFSPRAYRAAQVIHPEFRG